MPFKKGEIPKGAKPFKKNDPRINKKGAPKLPELKQAMAKILGGEDGGITELEEVLQALKAEAKKGNVRAAQELLDRAYGRPQQSIDHTTQGEKINIPIIKWVD